MKKVLGYLSGAPRVTTNENGESGGARSHILGVIGAYAGLGWTVRSFIYGDKINVENRSGSLLKEVLQSSFLGRLVADLIRIYLGRRNSKLAMTEIGLDIDYVYERYAIFQALGRRFQAKGIPWVLETQGLFYHEAKFDRRSISLTALAKKLELAAYRDADVVIAVSDVLKNLLIQEAGIDSRKILVVPNGVDIERFKPDVTALREVRKIPKLGFVGGLLRWQGLNLLLEAMSRSSQCEFELEIVGDGDERQNLEAQAVRLGLADRVRFVGRVPGDAVAQYIRDFDICFSGQIPSALGGMYHSPLKIYEYMACGKPVIASSFYDARSVIEDKDTGYLFRPGDVDDLVRTLEIAFLQRDKWIDLGRNARAEILSQHTWEVRGRQLIESIDLILRRET